MVGLIEIPTTSREQNGGRRRRTDHRLSKSRDRWSRLISSHREASVTRTDSRDPLRYVNGANTYASTYQFVRSSPVGMVDASGLYLGFNRLTGALGYGIYKTWTGVDEAAHAVAQGAANAYNATTSALGHGIYNTQQAIQRAIQELKSIPATVFHSIAESLYHKYCHCKQKQEGKYFGVGLNGSVGVFKLKGGEVNSGVQAIVICAAKAVSFYGYVGPEFGVGAGDSPFSGNAGPTITWGRGLYSLQEYTGWFFGGSATVIGSQTEGISVGRYFSAGGVTNATLGFPEGDPGASITGRGEYYFLITTVQI
jgi:hypothetical protein